MNTPPLTHRAEIDIDNEVEEANAADDRFRSCLQIVDVQDEMKNAISVSHERI